MIKISNLTFGYNSKHLLFKDLNLELSNGHIYGLLGKNGAGKSTLLSNIAGLVFPKHGICTVNGYKPADRLPAFLQEIFFIPEELYLPSITANSFAKSTGHFYPKFSNQQFADLLAELDVPSNVLMNKLSLGQRKKIMIAFGLSTNTSLLIMDEPTNGLDIPSKMQFRKIVASTLTDDRCIIISTHQVRDLDSLIDAVLILNKQEIVVSKSLDEIAEQLNFTTSNQVEKDNVLYSEANSIGVNTISANHDGVPSRVDLELLFNAVVGDHQSVLNLLK
ncbi:MAG: ABC transporter ATP-binding protein [Pedobacter sp.]|nr:MAG: ABC transporter ATP-binding protein [Pedobacter sp.]